MRAFKEKGVDGFVIHPRLGLDPAIPYMGERWLYFVRYAVDLAKEFGMKVMLYDEAMYPSGSCCGQVVAENPDYAAKGLKMTRDATLSEGERLVAETAYNGETVYFVLTPSRGGSLEPRRGGHLHPSDPSEVLRCPLRVFRGHSHRHLHRRAQPAGARLLPRADSLDGGFSGGLQIPRRYPTTSSGAVVSIPIASI